MLKIRQRYGPARRGIDSVIATVLTVVVAIVASLAAGGFVFGVMGHAQDSAQVVVTSASLVANDFTPAGNATTFTCGTLSAGSFLTLTNTGTASASVASVAIHWAGSESRFTPPGLCPVGASGSATATSFVLFAASSQMNPAAVLGQEYTGTVTLSSGAQVLLTGSWR